MIDNNFENILHDKGKQEAHNRIAKEVLLNTNTTVCII